MHHMRRGGGFSFRSNSQQGKGYGNKWCTEFFFIKLAKNIGQFSAVFEDSLEIFCIVLQLCDFHFKSTQLAGGCWVALKTKNRRRNKDCNWWVSTLLFGLAEPNAPPHKSRTLNRKRVSLRGAITEERGTEQHWRTTEQ